MTEHNSDPDILDQIAEEVGEITDEQDNDDDDKATRESSEDFDPDEYRRNMNDYDGGW